MYEQDGYDAFIKVNFCKRCKKHIMNCLCRDKTLEEIVEEKKEIGREYAKLAYKNKEE